VNIAVKISPIHSDALQFGPNKVFATYCQCVIADHFGDQLEIVPYAPHVNRMKAGIHANTADLSFNRLVMYVANPAPTSGVIQ
jgi:hypothetical protein